MGSFTDRMDFVLSGVFRVVFYRSLHMVSVPFKPTEVLGYALEQSAPGGHFGGTIERVRAGPMLSVWLWRNMRMGEDLPMDMWFFGANRGAQTVLVRTGWYKGNFSRRSVLTAIDPLGLVLTNGNGGPPPPLLP